MSDVQNSSRRDFLKKSAYVVPVIMTMSATPALAGQGSHHKDYDKKKRKKKDKYHSKKSHKKSKRH
ncbi:MAG: hypothetical protein IPM20_14150 [Gammaproteobacteria bacterium]|nr:hypothetical protein [Gammaproteobacteria bacterium]